MTSTEKLLREAREIAWRAFDEPTQETVMCLFQRLCDERDALPPTPPGSELTTFH